jgi:hypothetical protein
MRRHDDAVHLPAVPAMEPAGGRRGLQRLRPVVEHEACRRSGSRAYHGRNGARRRAAGALDQAFVLAHSVPLLQWSALLTGGGTGIGHTLGAVVGIAAMEPTVDRWGYGVALVNNLDDQRVATEPANARRE